MRDKRFKYRRPTAEQLTRRASSGGSRDGYISRKVKIYKAKNGGNFLRLLPPTWDGAEHYGLDVWVHYSVGADSGAYACRAKMKNKKCPICEEMVRAVRKGDEEYANKLKPRRRVLTYVIDREKESEGVQVYPMPPSIDEELSTLAVDRRSGEVFALDDPKEGYDVEFDKSGEGLSTRYSGIRLARKPSRLGDKEWLEHAIDTPLTGAIKYYPYDHMAAALAGAGADDDDDEDEDESPRSRRAEGRDDNDLDKKRKKRKAKDEDDDDEDEEDFDEDEDEDEPPKKKKKKKRVVEDDDDDDEDDFDEDDEEEDEPVRKRKKASRKEDDDEDEEEDDFDDEDEDDDEPPKKKKKKKKKKVRDRDEDDEDEDDD